MKPMTHNIWKALAASVMLVVASACLVVSPVWAANARINRVQSGTASFTTTTTDVTITSVDLTKAVLFFSYRVNNNTIAQIMVKGQISSATNVHFERITGGATVDIAWYVAEFHSGVTVQRAANTHASATTNVTITAVTLAQAFPVFSYMNDGSTWGNDDQVTAQLTSTTNLQLVAAAALNTVNALEWQVADYRGATVETGTTTLNAGSASTTQAITSVDLTRSIVMAEYTSPGNLLTDSAGVVTKFNSATQLNFQRTGTVNALTIRWKVVQFPLGVHVQSGEESFTNAETQRNVTITAVDLTKTIAIIGSISVPAALRIQVM
jgi:hypothetical protein